jgi:hypothetical protein
MGMIWWIAGVIALFVIVQIVTMIALFRMPKGDG